MFKRKTFSTSALIIATLLAAPVMADDASDALNSAIASDYNVAAAILKPMAASGNAHAQFNLALLYHSGSGMNQDEVAAVAWYHKAAENGSTQAQEYLAVGYAEGWFGLPRDAEKAKYWYNKSESKKQSPANRELAKRTK